MHEPRSSLTRVHRVWTAAALVQWALVVGVGVWLAVWWQPEPHSDWLHYWYAAGEPDRYERGGASLWLLAIPKALGWSPVASALALNLPAASLLGFLAYRVDPTRWRWLAQMVVAYLLLITPFFGIVQLDLIAAAQLALGLWFALDPRIGVRRTTRLALATMAVAFAVSTKPQYALVLWALLGMAVVTCLFARFRAGFLVRGVYGVLLAGTLLGFAADMAMRKTSGRMEAVRTSSAVTLYGGLLVSGDSREQGCGYWSVEAASAARADLGKPMAIAIRDRLLARPLGHWMSVVECKLPQIVSPPPYALYWLVESPNIRERIDASPDRERIDARYDQAIAWESRVYRVLTALILLACFWTSVRLWRNGSQLAGLPVLWILAFWGVHTIFEIQGRYFLGMFVVAPLLCAALLRQRPDAQQGEGVQPAGAAPDRGQAAA
ncbi:hypothetical protein [Luteimonas sp. R10]|uniref:hypothetical protein n=1 Tax=Luteimonas sp. R10 TaxID=3108176 RepID=UPI003089CBCC|nr:hypothetical protein U3649_07980 [Luteimonas sp. R10]